MKTCDGRVFSETHELANDIRLEPSKCVRDNSDIIGMYAPTGLLGVLVLTACFADIGGLPDRLRVGEFKSL